MHRILFALSLAVMILGLGCPPPAHPDEHYDGSSPFTGGDLFGDDDDDIGDDDDAVGDDDDDYAAANVAACEELEDFINSLECSEGYDWDKGCDKYASAPCDLTDYIGCLIDETFCGEFGPDVTGWKYCVDLLPEECM